MSTTAHHKSRTPRPRTGGELAYTVAEVLHKLPIGRNSLYAAIKDGTIPSIRIGDRILIPKAAFHEKFGNV
jgi:excisionase family DNA binding protein